MHTCLKECEHEQLFNSSFFLFTGGLENKDSSAKVKSKTHSCVRPSVKMCVCKRDMYMLNFDLGLFCHFGKKNGVLCLSSLQLIYSDAVS